MKNISSNVDPLNPELFPQSNNPKSLNYQSNNNFQSTNSGSSSQQQTPPATTTERAKNFSFASNYAADLLSTSDSFNHQRVLSSSLPLSNFNFQPISEFTAARRNDLYSAGLSGKPNAIVRPIRRFESTTLARPTLH